MRAEESCFVFSPPSLGWGGFPAALSVSLRPVGPAPEASGPTGSARGFVLALSLSPRAQPFCSTNPAYDPVSPRPYSSVLRSLELR